MSLEKIRQNLDEFRIKHVTHQSLRNCSMHNVNNYHSRQGKGEENSLHVHIVTRRRRMNWCFGAFVDVSIDADVDIEVDSVYASTMHNVKCTLLCIYVKNTAHVVLFFIQRILRRYFVLWKRMIWFLNWILSLFSLYSNIQVINYSNIPIVGTAAVCSCFFHNTKLN